MSNWFEDQKQKLMAATSNGLDIIGWLIPSCDTSKVNGSKGTKAFKSPFRNEKTASCNLWLNPQNNIWSVTDFGDESKSNNAIDLYMKMNHISQSDVSTAILELCMRFNVPTDRDQPKLKAAEFRSVPRTEEKPFEYVVCDWTPLHISVYNPKANHNSDEGKELYNNILQAAEHYGLHPVSEYSFDSKNKEGELVRITIRGTSVFPLFIYKQTGKDGKEWGKIYQPYANEKKNRFFHFGVKPERFIYGLDGLKKHYHEQLEIAELILPQNDRDDAKFMRKFKASFKLDHIIICSGGSDGINIAALGYYAIWSNSETNFLQGNEYAELKKYATNVYYVGDMDATGKKAAYKIGMDFIDLRIIRLPQELSNHRGWRDEKAKDVKDYCRYYSAYDFSGLLRIASPFQFWNFNPNSKAAIPYSFNPKAALHFLSEHGYCKFENISTAAGYELVKVDGNIVYKVRPDDLKTELINFCFTKRTNEDIINLIYRTKAIREEFARDLPWLKASFKRGVKGLQFWYFEDSVWKITADKTEVLKPGSVSAFAWADKVYKVPNNDDHEIKITEDLFTVTQDENKNYHLEIPNYDFQFLQFITNTARVYWSKEFKNAGQSQDMDQAQANELGLNKITSKYLSDDENNEQVLHFLSRCSMLGYLLHTHKEDSKAWAPWVTENTERDVKEAHGGTGKSLMFKKMHELLLNSVWKDGRNIKDEKFLFGNVNSTHELFVVADADKSTSLSPYFNAITDGLESRTLYSLGGYIAYEDAPKFVFISNYFPWDLHPSDLRRLWPIGFSDYYHAIGGLHTEERNPGKDFGRDIYSSWTPAEWVQWYNFMRCCLQLYLKYGRINPPMAQMQRQMAKIAMGQNFESWARDFFNDQTVNQFAQGFVPTPDNCSELIFIPVKVALHEYQHYLKNMRQTNERLTEQSFLKKVEAYAKYQSYTFNPTSLRNTSGRIQRKLSQKVFGHLHKIKPDVPATFDGDKFKSMQWTPDVHLEPNKVMDMIFIGTYQDRLKITEDVEAYEPPSDPF